MKSFNQHLSEIIKENGFESIESALDNDNGAARVCMTAAALRFSKDQVKETKRKVIDLVDKAGVATSTKILLMYDIENLPNFNKSNETNGTTKGTN